MIPSMAEGEKAHFAFTKQKTENRLDRDTDRKDFITYVSLLSTDLITTDFFCCL